MISLWKHIKLWYFNKRYKKYDSKEVCGVQVYSYWKLTKCVEGPGYICIPLRLRREDPQDQSLICSKSIRRAIELRIIKENKL